MNSGQEALFDLLLNALLQIGLFAVLAALFSHLVARAQARYQNWFYLAVLHFCLVVPVFNTLWRSPLAIVAVGAPQPALSHTGGVNQPVWSWQGPYSQPAHFTIPPALRNWLLFIWMVFVLYRLVRFGFAAYQVRRLRNAASPLSPARLGSALRILGASPQVAVLESAAIDDPVTIGVFRPAILLPSKVLPVLGENDLSAVLAHEYGHIRRNDFLVHIVSVLISLPVAWHPGIRYLMSKISLTREHACDDFAAGCLGKRREYAGALLRLASLCLHLPRSTALALSIFDGENLEARITRLTEKAVSLSRARAIGFALATGMTFGAGAVLMHSISLQARAEPSQKVERFAGTWHWMFGVRSFATLNLTRSESGLTGSLTGSRIALNDDGGLLRADPSEDARPKPITQARLEGSVLHLRMKDGFEFTMTLVNNSLAEIHPAGAPPTMKPIPATRVH